MVRIERITAHVAALDPFRGEGLLALLLTARFLVVMRCAARHQVVQWRVRIAAPADGDAMVDDSGNLELADI